MSDFLSIEQEEKLSSLQRAEIIRNTSGIKIAVFMIGIFLATSLFMGLYVLPKFAAIFTKYIYTLNYGR